MHHSKRPQGLDQSQLGIFEIRKIPIVLEDMPHLFTLGLWVSGSPDYVFPDRAARQWVLSVPYQLRFLLAAQPQVITKVLAIVHRVISTWLIKRTGLTVKSGAQTGAVTLLQHFGSALNAH